MATKKLTLLGSTGSIGTQTLSLVEPLGIKIVALSANRNIDLLEKQVYRFDPDYACVTDETAGYELVKRLSGCRTKVKYGPGALNFAVTETDSDTVLNSIVGIAGLQASIATAKSGKTLALANKESLVTGGRLLTDAIKSNGGTMLPVDSEHSAIFQCLQDRYSAPSLRRIFLTASGGPFFGMTRDELSDTRIEDALNHPNWKMGRKITVDSATLMNKGLELIEAMWLFSLAPENIVITVHRQSIVHSAVEFADGAVLAQLGVPDMRIPIQYALTYPERFKNQVPHLDVEKMANLTFEYPDEETFKCLKICKLAAKQGGLAPCAVNAANEVAVQYYLDGKIGFLSIADAVEYALNYYKNKNDYSLEDVFETDRYVREITGRYLSEE